MSTKQRKAQARQYMAEMRQSIDPDKWSRKEARKALRETMKAKGEW